MLNTEKIEGIDKINAIHGFADVGLAMVRLQAAASHKELLNTMTLNEDDE